MRWPRASIPDRPRGAALCAGRLSCSPVRGATVAMGGVERVQLNAVLDDRGYRMAKEHDWRHDSIASGRRAEEHCVAGL
eukprot:CAMPEP_0195577562 /NCGR_PEP_ID=MMETSP0814-20130614/10657_1 /TAXON_ID=97485 /ORGANISM="Prymnesium parvum, Strain Texoma1" /LENGTH=78 /DNA_ID=CAMNT_0040713971 /DNA_START=313 /DNA_END=547 /DNA_ORIENTATION=-